MDIIDDVTDKQSDNRKPETITQAAPLVPRATEARLLDYDDDQVTVVNYFKDENYQWYQVKLMIHRSNLQLVADVSIAKDTVLQIQPSALAARFKKDGQLWPLT